MEQPIYWIGVDFENSPPSEKELQKIKDVIREGVSDQIPESQVIVSTKEVKPMDRDELTDYLNQALDAVEE